MMAYLLWIPALVIAVRALCVAYKSHYPDSGRTPLEFGLFGYSYVGLAFGALVCAAEMTGCAGDLHGLGRPVFLVSSAGLILTDRRSDMSKWSAGVARRIAGCFRGLP